MISGWIALKHRTSNFGEWLISPKEYFEKFGRIPDCHANLKVPGMEEVSDHTLKTLDGSDGVSLLLSAGFAIEENPNWYWMRYTPFECSGCRATVTSFCPGDHSGCPNDFRAIRAAVFGAEA